jgi:GT2 family glycosyltransferase
MTLQPDWLCEACALLERRPEVVAVAGRVQERNSSIFYRALQLDWQQPEGEVLYCGGAAMYRRDALTTAGGFPEDVAYGEEPLLCWRIRNEYGGRIYHLPRPMVLHDLAYTGFRDYWRRNVRVGETYAEIAVRLRETHEPFWTPEVRHNLRWFVALLLLGVLLCTGLLVRGAAGSGIAGLVLLLLTALILRKTIQKRREGWTVALVYALHTYCAKMGIGYGILRWKRRHR